MFLLLSACHKPPEPPPTPAVVVETRPPAPTLTRPEALQPFPGESGEAVCADGRVASNFWIGEYPSPVIQVDTKVQVRGKTHPCAMDTIAMCTVPPGLYHPWVRDSPHDFATVQPILRYRVLSTHTNPEIPGPGPDGSLPQGTQVEVLSYLSEGFCSMRIGARTFEAGCPDEQHFELLPETRPTDQYVGVVCEEGNVAWIQDTRLLAIDGVREGQILGFGEVSASE